MDTDHHLSTAFRPQRRIAAAGYLLILCLFAANFAVGQPAVGQWRDHFSFNKAVALAPAHGRIYTAYEQCVGYYDFDDDAVGRMTKVDYLSDAGIAKIAYDSLTRCLVVAYTNSNIDIIHDEATHNISDLKRSEIAGDKAIYAIRFYNRRAYIACGIGILIIDLDRYEIESTCQIGIGGGVTPVFDLAFDGSHIYAATLQGIRTIGKNDRFPNIADRWIMDSTSRLSGRRIALLAVNGGTLLAAAETFDPSQRQLYRADGAGDFAIIDSGDIRSLRCADGYTTVAYADGISIYNPTYALSAHYDSFTWGDLLPNDAIRDRDGSLWIAHGWAGLIHLMPDKTSQTFNPQGNVSDDVASLTVFNDATYLCPGGKTSTYANKWYNGTLYTFKEGLWNQLTHNAANDTLIDFLSATVNPKNSEQIAAASWGYGIAEINDNQIIDVYNESNTNGAIEAYRSGTWRHVRIGAVAYDKSGNLWATNSLVNKGLVVHYADGGWQGFETAKMIGNNEIDHIVCDSVRGFKWITGKSNRIFVHDGESKMAYVSPNNGSKLETNRVNCLVQDRKGDLWIGTDKGIKVIFDGYNAFGNGGNGELAPVNCSNIIISNGEFVEYLMAYEDVQCIAVDGANRKWVGTANNGLYLLSATGLEELNHFTTVNSPLPSNQIVALAVQPLSGEVFIGTASGTMGYRGTATYASSQPSDEVHAFPNPIRPDYNGPIAIKGFTNNALVHITDIAGHVVFSTQAFGGQAIWNGCTNEGKRVGSGVYYVFASDSEGGNRSVGKVLFIK